MYVTPHALERYQIHHPSADSLTVHYAVGLGSVESPQTIQAVCRRHKEARDSIYILAHDKWGIFVLSADKSTLITYLRLEPFQRDFFLPKAISIPAPSVVTCEGPKLCHLLGMDYSEILVSQKILDARRLTKEAFLSRVSSMGSIRQVYHTLWVLRIRKEEYDVVYKEPARGCRISVPRSSGDARFLYAEHEKDTLSLAELETSYKSWIQK